MCGCLVVCVLVCLCLCVLLVCLFLCLFVCWLDGWLAGWSVGRSVTHSFNEPNVAPYWPTCPCLKGWSISQSVVPSMIIESKSVKTCNCDALFMNVCVFEHGLKEGMDVYALLGLSIRRANV